MLEHWFWLALTVAAVGWYATITVYVAIRGALDIRHMLARLEAQRQADAPPATPPSPGQPVS